MHEAVDLALDEMGMDIGSNVVDGIDVFTLFVLKPLFVVIILPSQGVLFVICVLFDETKYSW